ncbi:MAG: DUF1254 domain-containing protein [Paracoccaceae bacterium]
MKAALISFALATGVVGVGTHLTVINALPTFIMSRAFSGLESSGIGWNAWQSAPKITPQTQSVVRSSPDLAYVVCLLDLSNGPVRISVPRWVRYGSLSIFDHTTTNVHIESLEGSRPPANVIVATADQSVTDNGTPVIRLPGNKGLALIRRLAPDTESHQAATALVKDAECAVP